MKNITNSNRLSILSFILFSLFTTSISWAQCVDELYVSSITTSTTAATFTWDAADPETGLNYQWEIRTANAPGSDVDPLNGYVVSGSTGNGITSVTISGLDFDTEYFFYVRYKCDATTFSPWQATGATSFNTETLQDPTATAAILVSNTNFIAKWNPVLGASSYRLDVSTDSGFTSILASYDDLSVSTIYLKVTGLTANTFYYYRVRAVGINGDGSYTTGDSNTITVKTTVSDTGISIWNGLTWTNGTPNRFRDAIIDANYDTAVNGSFEAKSLLVNSGKVLNIESVGTGSGDGRYVKVWGALVNEAGVSGIVVQSNGNLIQRDGSNNIENSGAITVKRNSNPLWRLDYTMWSTPIIGTQTLGQFSPNTSSTRFYSYDTATDKFISITSGTILSPGSGYLVRMPNDWVSNPAATTPLTPTGAAASWTGVFTGIPNGNNVSIPLNLTGNAYNMVGNPYPSSVSALSFLATNNVDFPTILGTLYFWRRTNDETPGTDADSYYATYTALGGTAAADAPTLIPNGLISKGQGFIVQADVASLEPDMSVKFENSQRPTTYPAQFMKKANKLVAEEGLEDDGLERNRLWLNLTSSEGGFGQTLVGYMTNASNELDRYDGKYFNDGALALTSYLDNKEYIIQARALPFVDTDVVPLLFKTPFAGDYTISIAQMDGFFAEGLTIYLKDNLTNTVNNLNEKPYNFSSEVGVFSNRFSVVYNTSSLSTKNPILDANAVVVYKSNQTLNINSGAIAMKSVELYDMSGRVIYKKENVDNTKLAISNLNFQDQIIIIKINTEAGIINKKYSFTR